MAKQPSYGGTPAGSSRTGSMRKPGTQGFANSAARQPPISLLYITTDSVVMETPFGTGPAMANKCTPSPLLMFVHLNNTITRD